MFTVQQWCSYDKSSRISLSTKLHFQYQPGKKPAEFLSANGVNSANKIFKIEIILTWYCCNSVICILWYMEWLDTPEIMNLSTDHRSLIHNTLAGLLDLIVKLKISHSLLTCLSFHSPSFIFAMLHALLWYICVYNCFFSCCHWPFLVHCL